MVVSPLFMIFSFLLKFNLTQRRNDATTYLQVLKTVDHAFEAMF
jgi:hypothetical protein